MSEKLRLQEPIRSPLETPRLITPLPYRSGTSFLAWAIVNNNQPVPDVFSKMTKIAASGRLGQVGPLAPHLDVGFIQAPARIKATPPEPAQPLLHLRGVALDPAIDRRMVDRNAAFRQHFLKVAIADRIATIPAHRPQDHITLEMAPLEIRHRSVRPISAKHAQASRFLQQ